MPNPAQESCRQQIAGARQARGRLGEDLAAKHLAARGYAVLERNLRVGNDEADLVALAPDGAVAVVEVKTRAGPWHGEDRVDSVKRHNLLRLAASLAREERFANRMFQFDVVAVELRADGTAAQVLHFPHAFDASGTPW